MERNLKGEHLNLLLDMLGKTELDEAAFDELDRLHSKYTDYSVFTASNFIAPFERKMEFFKPLLNGGSKMVIDVSQIKSEGYSVLMYNEFLDSLRGSHYFFYDGGQLRSEQDLKNSPRYHNRYEEFTINGEYYFDGKALAAYLEDLFTIQEIEENRILKEFRLGKKRFGAGGKITRVLSGIADTFNLNYVKDRVIGNMTQTDSPRRFNMTLHPVFGYLAGMISNSCLSPEGSNRHAGPNTAGYKNVAMIYNNDLTWRAFAAFDFEEKVFAVYKGYPRENYFGQYLLKSYFEELGFTYEPNYFEFPAYFDRSTSFKGDDSRRNQNSDAYHHYSWKETITQQPGDEADVLIPFYYSDYNDDYDFDPDYENNDQVWCDYEEEYYYYDDVSWSEYLESYISNWGISYFIDNNFDRIKEIFYRAIYNYFEDDEMEIEPISNSEMRSITRDLLWSDNSDAYRAYENMFPELDNKSIRQILNVFDEMIFDEPYN